METRVFVAALATALAFACSFSATVAAVRELRNRSTALAAQGTKIGISALLAWRMRNGYAFAARPAQALLGVRQIKGFVERLVEACESKGITVSEQSMASLLIVWLGAIALFVGLATGSPVAAGAVPACVVAALSVAIGNMRDKRWERARDSVPAALESMASCFGAGFTLLQTFTQISKEVPGPLGATFARSAHVLEMGGSAQQALEELRTGAYASELSFVAVALDVQHQSGGAMKQVLNAATETVKDELALRRSLTVQTAQAKLSARVVSIMPFILIAAFSLASPDFLMPFFSSPQGYVLLAAALCMQVAGIALVRKALAVEGVA